MAKELFGWDYRPSGLRAPALVCAFKGWSDAGEGASTAMRFLRTRLGAERFMEVDVDECFDFQAARPRVRLTEGRIRKVTWPRIEAYEVRIPRAPRDLILLYGNEPSFRWKGFSESVVELAEALEVQLVVTLGTLMADVPHTQPAPITGVASDEFLLERLGIEPPTYQGPTGIVGVLHSAAAAAGLPAVSLWAAVPHYVAATPNPKAALALVRRLEGLVGVSVDASDLEEQVTQFETQVDRAVETDPEVKEFVERLEQAIADGAEFDPADLPSGDALAKDFQRFLRQRGPDGK